MKRILIYGYMKKRKNINYIKLFCLLLLSAKIHFTYAQEYIIGVEQVSYYPLFDYTATDTNRPSFTKDILTAFFEHHNYSYRFVALPIKRFNKWYVEKGIDFKFPDNVRWRTDKQLSSKITFSQSVVKLMAGSYVLKSNANYQRNDIKKLGTILGFVPTLWFDKVESNELQLIEENTPYGIIKHILYGNVDATNIDSNVIRHNLKLLKKPNAIVLNTNIKHEVFSYHLSSIKHPQIIKQFNAFLQNNPKLLQQLKAKYDIIEKF
jgi:hypothetical protein